MNEYILRRSHYDSVYNIVEEYLVILEDGSTTWGGYYEAERMTLGAAAALKRSFEINKEELGPETAMYAAHRVFENV